MASFHFNLGFVASLTQANVMHLVKTIRVQIGSSLAIVLLLLQKWEELTKACEPQQRETDTQIYLIERAQALSLVQRQYWWNKLLQYDISLQYSNELFAKWKPLVYVINKEPQRQMGVYNLWEYLQIVSELGVVTAELGKHHIHYCFTEAAKKANTLTTQSGVRCHHWVAYHHFAEYEEDKNVHEWIMKSSDTVADSRLLNVLVFDTVEKERVEFESTDQVTLLNSNAFTLAVQLVSNKIDMFMKRGYLFQPFGNLNMEQIDEPCDAKEEKVEEVTICALFWNWVKKKPVQPQIMQIPAITEKRAPSSPRKSNITIGWLANDFKNDTQRPLLSPRIIPT